VGNALLQRFNRGAQVYNQVGRGQQRNQDLIQVLVNIKIALADGALQVKIAGEDFSIFIDATILHHGALGGQQLFVNE
jgi:hypothetical protein